MPVDVLRGGRLGRLDRDAVKYTSSVDSDRLLVKPVVEINKAHMVMLIERGVVNRSHGALCLKALSGVPESLKLNPELEDVHMNIEAYVIEKVGEEAGGQLNLGKSRNDQVATAIRIVLRGYILEVVSSVLKLCRIILEKCSEHVKTVMPGYTHLQHAQPVTLAHHLLAAHDSLKRDCERLMDAYGRVNMSPMGAAALATTSFNIDRGMVASLLGFKGLVENSIDAVSSRDFAVEVLSNLSLLMTNLSRIAEELILWSSYEFAAVEIPDEYASTSSIMPQKKNPVVAELIRAKASMVYGDLMAALSLLKALPYSYNLDLQELTPRLWDGCETALASTRILADMIAGVRFDASRLHSLAADDMSTATDLADFLVEKLQVPFRTAHRIVGVAARRAADEKRSFLEVVKSELSGVVEEVLGRRVEVSSEELEEILRIERAVERRCVIGGPMSEEVLRMIRSRMVEDDTLERWVQDRRRELEEAEAKLSRMVGALIEVN